MATKIVYCSVSCWPNWSSAAEVVLIEATSSLGAKCHAPYLHCELAGSRHEQCRARSGIPSTSLWGQPTPCTQGCTSQWQHPGVLTVPWPLWPLSRLLSSGEKPSTFTTTQQFKEETLLAHIQTPKAWQCNQLVSPAACQARPSAPSIFFPHLLDCINMKNNIRKFVVMGLEFLSQVYFNTCRILDIHWAIYRDRVTKKALYFWKPQGHGDRLSELLSLLKLLAKETSKHHASL